MYNQTFDEEILSALMKPTYSGSAYVGSYIPPPYTPGVGPTRTRQQHIQANDMFPQEYRRYINDSAVTPALDAQGNSDTVEAASVRKLMDMLGYR